MATPMVFVGYSRPGVPHYVSAGYAAQHGISAGGVATVNLGGGHGTISIAPGGSQYDVFTDTTYVSTGQGIIAYKGRDTTGVGRAVSAGGGYLDVLPKDVTEVGREGAAQQAVVNAQQQAAEQARQARVELAAKLAANRAAAVKGITLNPPSLPAGLSVVRGWVVPTKEALKELSGGSVTKSVIPISERGKKISAGASSEGVWFEGKYTPMFYEGKYVGGKPIEETAVIAKSITPYLQQVREKMGEKAFKKLYYSSKSYENAAKNYGGEKTVFERDVRVFNKKENPSESEYNALKAREAALNEKYSGLEELRLGVLKEGYGDVERYYKINPPSEQIEQKQAAFQLTAGDWLTVGKQLGEAKAFVAKYGVKAWEEKTEWEQKLPTESEKNLFQLPGVEAWEKGVTGVGEYFWEQDIFGRKGATASFLGEGVGKFEVAARQYVVGGLTSAFKPTSWQTGFRGGAVIVRKFTTEPEAAVKQVGTDFYIAARKAPEVFTTPEGLGAVAGTAASFFLLTGGKPFAFLKYPSTPEAVGAAAVERGKPLSVSFGKVFGEEVGKGYAIRVKAVKFELGETGVVAVPIDKTFLGTLKQTAGGQLKAFIRTNISAAGKKGGFKVLSIEKINISTLKTEAEAVVTAKGMRIELKTNRGATVFTRVKGDPATMFLGGAEVTGEGYIRMPSTRKWTFDLSRAKESWMEGIVRKEVVGEKVPFKVKYVTTSKGGIVGEREPAPFNPLGINKKGGGIVDAGAGGVKQELFIHARTKTTPIIEKPGFQKLFSYGKLTVEEAAKIPQELRISFVKGEPFLKYYKRMVKGYGEPSVSQSYLRLRELGETELTVRGVKRVIETWSFGGREYPVEPIGKPLELPKSAVGKYKPFSIIVDGQELPFKIKGFGDVIKQLRKIRAEAGKGDLTAFRERAGSITAKGKLTTPTIENFFNKIRGREFYEGSYFRVASNPVENAAATWHTHPFEGIPSEGDLINSLQRGKPGIIVSEKGFTVIKPKEGVTFEGMKAKYGKDWVLDTYAKQEEFKGLFDVKQYAKESPIIEKSNLPEGYTGKLARVGSSKIFGFGKVMKMRVERVFDNVGGNKLPRQRQLGGAGEPVEVGGGMKQMEIRFRSGAEKATPKERVAAVLQLGGGTEVRAAAAKAVSAFYGKTQTQARASAILGGAAGAFQVTKPREVVSSRLSMLVLPRSITQNRNITAPMVRAATRSTSIVQERVSTRAATRALNIISSRQGAFTTTRAATQTRPITEIATRVTPMMRVGVLERTAVQTRTVTLTRVPSPPLPLITPRLPPPPEPPTRIIPRLRGGASFDKVKKGKGKRKGWFTLVKRRGKWLKIGGIAPRGVALKKGESFVARTLGASFKVKPSNVEIEGVGGESYSAPKFLRGYRVSRGQKIPLKDEFIQRAGYRLSSKSERSEIQGARVAAQRLRGLRLW